MAITTPEDIDNLILWIDGSNPACVDETGGVITQLNDLSINSRPPFDEVQGEAPTVVQHNGHNAIGFGTEIGHIRQNSNALAHSTPCTSIMFYVDDSGGAGGTASLMDIQSSSASHRLRRTTGFNFTVRIDGNNISLPVPPSSDSAELVITKLETTSSTLTAIRYDDDNVPEAPRVSDPFTFVNPGTGNRWVLGSANSLDNHFAHKVCEFIVYDHVLTPEETQDVIDYIADKWAASDDLIQPVTNLDASVSGNSVTLSWKGPYNTKDTDTNPEIWVYEDFETPPANGVLHTSGHPPILVEHITPRCSGTKTSYHNVINDPNRPHGNRFRSEWSDQTTHDNLHWGTSSWMAYSVFIPVGQEEHEGSDMMSQLHTDADAIQSSASMSFSRQIGVGVGASCRLSYRYSAVYDPPTNGDRTQVILLPPWHKGQDEPATFKSIEGVWNDYVVHVRHAWDGFTPEGILEVWWNGQKIIHVNGPNGQHQDTAGYWKFGSYASVFVDDVPEGTQIERYYDEYRQGVAGLSDFLTFSPVGCTGFDILDDDDAVVASLDSNIETYTFDDVSAGQHTYKVRATYDIETTGTPTDISQNEEVTFDISDTGLELDRDTGILTCRAGTPPGTYTIKVNVTNDGGPAESDDIVWVVS